MRVRLSPSSVFLVLLLAGAALVPTVSGFYQTQVVAFGLIDVQLALGLSLVSGYAGQVSLGQAGFFGIGAYAAGLSATRLGLPMAGGVAIAILVSAAAGIVVGLPSLRVRGLYLAMVTLMFSLMVETIASNVPALTGGLSGMRGIRRPVLGPGGPLSDLGFFYLLLVVTAAVTLIGLALVRSPIGRMLVAIRDDENAAEMLGVPTSRYKLFAFLVSAGVAGLAGAMYAYYLGVISPEAFSPSLSITLLLMTIIGGMGRLEGAIVGALVVDVLPEVLRFTRGFWNVAFGALLVLMIILLPDGLISLPARLRRPGSRRLGQTASSPGAAERE